MPETIFDAVLRVAKTNGGADQLSNQEDQPYLYAICKALSDCAQEMWESLPVSAHEWYNNAAKMINAGKMVPPPEGFKSALKPIPVIQKPAPPPKPTVQQKAKPEKAAVPTPPPVVEQKERAKRNKNAGILDAIRKTIILNPLMNAKQVHEHIVKNGFPDASLAIVAVNTGDVKRVLALVRELGYWKESVNVEEKKTA